MITAEEAAEAWYDALWMRFALIIAIAAGVWTIAQSQRFEWWMARVIRWALHRWTDLEVRDFAALLHLSGGYHVTELKVSDDNWLAGKRLQQLRLSAEGVLVLGVERADGSYIGVPRGQTRLEPGDTLLIYGHEDRLAELDNRPAGAEGSRKHVFAVEELHEHEQQGHEPDKAQ